MDFAGSWWIPLPVADKRTTPPAGAAVPGAQVARSPDGTLHVTAPGDGIVLAGDGTARYQFAGGTTAVYANAVTVVCDRPGLGTSFSSLMFTIVLMAALGVAIFLGLARRALTVGGVLLALGAGSLILVTHVRELTLADPPAELVAAWLAVGVTGAAAALHRIPVGKLDAKVSVRAGASALSSAVLAVIILGAAGLGFALLVGVLVFATPTATAVVLGAMALPGVLLWRRSQLS